MGLTWDLRLTYGLLTLLYDYIADDNHLILNSYNFITF